MNAHRFHWLIAVITLACFLLVAWSVPADAQKKQKPKTTTTTTKETPKEQPKEEPKEQQEEKVEETLPAPALATSVSLPNKFVDFLKQQVGQKTNLGTFKKFAGDYLVFEEDLTTTLIPLTSVQSAKLVKDDESSPATLEIKLISKD